MFTIDSFPSGADYVVYRLFGDIVNTFLEEQVGADPEEEVKLLQAFSPAPPD